MEIPLGCYATLSLYLSQLIDSFALEIGTLKKEMVGRESESSEKGPANGSPHG
jgi:hypothetical protein